MTSDWIVLVWGKRIHETRLLKEGYDEQIAMLKAEAQEFHDKYGLLWDQIAARSF